MVRGLAPAAGEVTLGKAADAYLATLRGDEQASTRRTYGRILRWIVTGFGSDTAPDIDPERFAAWFTARWAGRSPSTWNVSLDAIRSAAAWWMRQGWIIADPSRMLTRRRPRPDRARALSCPEVEQLLSQGRQPARADILAALVRARREIRRGPGAQRRGPRPAQPPRQGPAQGRGGRHHRVADRNRAPAAAAADGP